MAYRPDGDRPASRKKTALERKRALAWNDPLYAAQALLAFRRGVDANDEDAPEVGALMLAEFLYLVRGFLGKGR